VNDSHRVHHPAGTITPPPEWEARIARLSALAGAEAGSVDPGVDLVDGFRPTDGGNADRLMARHGEHLRHVAIWRKWLVWDGTRWRVDHGDRRILARARDVVAHLLKVAADATNAEERKQIVKFALKTDAAKALRALVDVAASSPGVLVDHDELDADGWLLNLPNGTLDLRTGHLSGHDPGDLLTLMAGAALEAAPAPIFTAFVEQVLPDPAVRRYVQSRLGAALAGVVGEHELNIAIGAGANGKTTLFSIVHAVMGDYATVAPKSLLISSRHEHHPTDRTALFRRRLAYAGEIPEGARLNEALVKELTGGDRITARRMREDFWTYTPTHKLWLFANHLPRVVGTDHAIWRRVRVVPFTVSVPKDQQDPHLAERVIATEASGVLGWLLEGCQAWQEGVPAPPAVLTATERYRLAEDTAARFIASELELHPGATLVAGDLWTAHEQWCTENGVPHWEVSRHVQRVAAQLKAGGARVDRTQIDKTKVRIWTGVALRRTGVDRGCPDSPHGTHETNGDPPVHPGPPADTTPVPEEPELF
jgi:putative DNA primase/helicase